jgi:hypothetical protein
MYCTIGLATRDYEAYKLETLARVEYSKRLYASYENRLEAVPV